MSASDPNMAKPERPKTFRQSDLRRAIRAARGAGLEVKHVEIDPTTGKIIITTTAGAAPQASTNTLDKWLATNARPS
jgi:hypothetical protein